MITITLSVIFLIIAGITFGKFSQLLFVNHFFSMPLLVSCTVASILAFIIMVKRMRAETYILGWASAVMVTLNLIIWICIAF